MGERPRLSVVIPTRDTRKLTMNCLASLWLCSTQPDEVIVVDDGSEDATASAVIHKFPRHIVVRLPKSQGFSVAANHGVAKASGNLVLLLNSDTEVDPSSISAIHEAFERNSDLGIAGAALRYPDGSPQWSGGKSPSLCGALLSPPGSRRSWPACRAGVGFALLRARPEAGSTGSPERRWWCGEMSGNRSVRSTSATGSTARISISVSRLDRPVGKSRSFRSSRSRITAGARSLRRAAPWARIIPNTCGPTFFASIESSWGSSHARKASRWLRMGGRLRIFGRRLSSPLISSERKLDFRSETTAYDDALRAIGDSPVGDRRSIS